MDKDYLFKLEVLSLLLYITHYEKSDWSRAFNQFTMACELDMINAISATDIAFIMSSSTSAWFLSPVECSRLALISISQNDVTSFTVFVTFFGSVRRSTSGSCKSRHTTPLEHDVFAEIQALAIVIIMCLIISPSETAFYDFYGF